MTKRVKNFLLWACVTSSLYTVLVVTKLNISVNQKFPF